MYFNLYAESFFNDFKTILKEKNSEFDLYGPEKIDWIASNMRKNTINYPFVSVSFGYAYVTDGTVSNFNTLDDKGKEHTYDFNFKDTMPVKIFPKLTILATEISQAVEMEKLIFDTYTNARKLTEVNPLMSDEKIQFSIAIDSSHEIERKGGTPAYMKGEHLYQTIISFSCTSNVLFTQKPHPAELAFDKSIEEKVIEKLAALEDMKASLLEQDGTLNSNKIALIDESWKELDCLINVTQGVTTYAILWDVMQKKHCNAESALETIKQEIAERKEKEEAEAKRLEEERAEFEKSVKKAIRDRLYEGTDDIAFNKYTDAVVEDISSRFEDHKEIKIYGGSEIADWITLYDKGEVTLPAILVSAKVIYGWSLVSSPKGYTNLTDDGQPVFHKYDETAFPIRFGVYMHIFANSPDQADMIVNQIKDTYSGNSITLNVDDQKYEREKTPIQINVPRKNYVTVKEKFDGWSGNIEHRQIYSIGQYSVYYARNYGKDEIRKNPIMDLRLLQQAKFALESSKKIDKAINQMDSDYKNLITKKSSFFGFFKSGDYKKLKSCFDYGLAIDRSLFDSVLSDITYIYPLYEKMVSGLPYETIMSELVKYKQCFTERWKYLCDLLFLPLACPFDDLDTTVINRSNDVRSEEGLSFCIDCLEQKRKKSAFLAAIEYKDSLEQDLKRYLARQIEIYNSYQDEVPQSSSSEGSILGSVLSTAAGVALGNSSLKKEARKQTQLMEEQAKRERERDRQAELQKWREASEYRLNRDNIIKINQERRRKGLPELPVPPWRG